MRCRSFFSFAAISRIAIALDCSPSTIQAALSSDVTVNFASPLRENATFNVPPSDTGYPTSPVGLPALCAVSIQVQSTGNTSYGFGLFLPDDWNGRFLAVGNGGFAGGINWLDMVLIKSPGKLEIVANCVYRQPAHAMALLPCPQTLAIIPPSTWRTGLTMSPKKSKIGVTWPCTARL